MEDLRSALMEDPNEFVELDDYLESIEAPMYHDFTAIDNSKPDGPSWFCSRIGCNGEHEHVDPQELDRRFKILVMAARTPNFKHRKAAKQDGVRSTPIHARTVPAKPASAMRDRSVAAKALVFGSPKKMARKPSSQLRQKKTDCPIMKLTKEVASLAIEEELPSSDGAVASTSEGSVLSTTSDSVSTNSDSRSEASVVPDSCQGSEVEADVNTTDLEDNKENIPSLEEKFERSAEVSVVHAVSEDPEIEADESATSLEDNCKKPNMIQKAIKEPNKILKITHPGQGEKSRRTTKPKPFRLLTNERVVQRETNLEKKQNRDAPRETVSSLKCRDGVKSEARLGHGKTRRLGEEKLTASNPECQQEKLVAKSQKEVAKVASSRQPLKSPRLMVKRNSPSSSSQGNKITPANACTRGKKLEIASCLRRNEARTAQCKNVRFAGKLITTLPQAQEAECRKVKFGEQSCTEVVKVARSTQSLKTRSKMPSRNAESSSQDQNGVVAENAICSQGKSEQLLKEVVKVIPSRQSLKTQSKIPARIAQRSSQHRNEVATDNAPCSQGKGEKLHKEVVKMAPSRQSLKTQSKIPARNAHTSSQHRNEVVTENASCSQGKGEQLCTEVVKMAPSRQSLKTQSIKMPARNAQSSSQHHNEVVNANATCSLGNRLATTVLKGPNLYKIHTSKDCTKKPVCWR